ncbi:glycosyltransferase [Ferruginibacter lapsinanis]|uniref:glycosyltransferase family 2 protein n=1 Tax=Ferruginibacter lapsinanis TaxID=563172 RepID=UPI001E38F97F|nr:glycosyltransferase family 2 protein [Ferruginibacter lapsinanis]UEG49445.1 glycosyltransferase [Ferruginibacter lapsinanis]
MKISLITVTYNSEKFLEDCIKSVVIQDYHSIEHIIIDGGSSDGTIQIIKKYNDHIAKWISEKDEGMYDAINKGMAMATGDVIGILNSDDMLASSDVISAIVTAFEQNGVDSVYGDLAYVAQEDTQKVHRFWKGNSYKRSRFNFGWMPAHPTFYVKRSVVEKLGGYESKFYTAADYELMARYLYKNKISAYHLPKLLVRMRTGGMSNSNLKSRLRANRRDYLAMRKNNIPFAFLVSILKPLRKLPQYFKKVIE